MGEAIRYAWGQWTALGQFLKDGEVPLDTNAIERILRGVAISRKNFLFVASPEGGRWAAGAYTLIESAKVNGVEPYALDDPTEPARSIHLCRDYGNRRRGRRIRPDRQKPGQADPVDPSSRTWGPSDRRGSVRRWPGCEELSASRS
jgi:hypothetical protein